MLRTHSGGTAPESPVEGWWQALQCGLRKCSGHGGARDEEDCEESENPFAERSVFSLVLGLLLELAQVVTAVLVVICGIKTRETACLTASLSNFPSRAHSHHWGWVFLGAFMFLFIINLFIKAFFYYGKFQTDSVEKTVQ